MRWLKLSRRVAGFHAAPKSPVAMLISMLVCKAGSVAIPMKLDRRGQKGICFLLNAIGLSHKDKETAVCKFLPWCSRRICWAFPANTGQGCPTHPCQAIRKRKSLWVAPAHPPSVPDGQSRLPGSRQSPSPPLPPPQHAAGSNLLVIWARSSLLCSLINRRTADESVVPWLPGQSSWEQLFGFVFGGARCLARTRAEPNPSRRSRATAQGSKPVCPFSGAQGAWQTPGHICWSFLKARNSFPAK